MVSKYKNIIEEASRIISKVYNSEEISTLSTKSESLIKVLDSEKYIKVPFVGDFSAGKSTLINGLIERRGLLPTDIAPTTAVSYELYYSVDERLEQYENDNLILTTNISGIRDLNVKAGQVVKVYIDNEYIKQLEDKNIVLVDMPGIDSGLEEHQKAIMNYIQEGTSFIIVNDVEQGTLRSSTLSFIREISEYNLKSAVFISKSDKKSDEDVLAIKNHIQSQIKQYMKGDVIVGATSSAKQDFLSISDFLNSINATSLIETKVKEKVKHFLESLITDLKVRISVSSIDSNKFAEKLKQLEKEKEKITATIRMQKDNLPSVDIETDRIIEAVKEQLLHNETHFVSLINSGASSDQINSEILSIVRPMIINSINAQNISIDSMLSESVDSFNITMHSLLSSSVKNSVTLDALGDIKGGVTKLVDIGGNFINRYVGKLLIGKGLFRIAGAVTTIVNPLIGIVGTALISFFTGSTKDEATERMNRIKLLFKTELIKTLADSLKSNVKNVLEEEQNNQLISLEGQMKMAIERVEMSIGDISVKGKSQDEFKQFVNNLYASEKELEKLLVSIN